MRLQGRESQNLIDATVPFYGDDSQFTSGEYMQMHGIHPKDLEMLAGTRLNLQDLALINSLKQHFFNLRMQQTPSNVQALFNARNSKPSH